MELTFARLETLNATNWRKVGKPEKTGKTVVRQVV
jgi:hypothetical protein